jgi:putative flavoprotein involved in K+ transport
VAAGQPGLYFVGLYFLHSLTSPLVGGVGRDAAHIAGQLARRVGSAGRRATPADRPITSA